MYETRLALLQSDLRIIKTTLGFFCIGFSFTHFNIIIRSVPIYLQLMQKKDTGSAGP